MPAEIKPCPFCACADINYKISSAKSKSGMIYYHFYKCGNCSASATGRDQFHALEKWNQRAGTKEENLQQTTNTGSTQAGVPASARA
jgi:Lar family restriction alleviation protein